MNAVLYSRSCAEETGGIMTLSAPSRVPTYVVCVVVYDSSVYVTHSRGRYSYFSCRLTRQGNIFNLSA